MRVFVTGATGFIGSAIVRELIGAGHEVLGLARSDAAAASLATAGAAAHRGSLDGLDSLKRGVDASDGVIHTGFIHDFSNFAAACELDRLAIEALGITLANSGRPLVVTSVSALLTPGRFGTEEDAANPISAAAHRVASEEAALSMASHGVRVSVVRLPPSVHGDIDHGFVPAMINVARSTGVSAYVGDGANRWSAVHRIDAARLYRLALEAALAGAKLHAIGDESVPIRDIASVIGRRLNVPIISKSPEEAAGHFGWLAHFLSMDYPMSSALTQERFGWRPVQPTLIPDIDREQYFTT
ncbi:SDR family oxidoreductase [Paenibacillus sp. N3.4]|uniref:SDR family oxidoreductase n=1 Tax=Paenibacillus sp. N3.4 TaxID=2603222 RepID=UPI0011C77B92|nr:SDR family oxidoreductase [Paenibacillus sp. N3.4]TXK71678.1 SDR family oxidoreductase [Paenibacillus sp. N3.4]TXK71686.1 SDR family oxidoreductase [Paenibacillus sp. N3.4]